MDNYRTNRPGCGQRHGNNFQMPCQNTRSIQTSCSCNQQSMYRKVDTLPVAMAYIPHTHFGQTYELCKGLQFGTIFPDLHKPFCGKGGGGCNDGTHVKGTDVKPNQSA